MLTPWELELEMLEGWLENPKLVEDCHKQTIMQIAREEHSEELLKIFNHGAE
jgi:GTP cyclohydrolase FolE2